LSKCAAVDVRTSLKLSLMPSEPLRVGDGALRFSHSGARHLLGFGADYFGIWDRQTPGGPIGRFPRTDEGWRDAWLEFVELEPHPAEVALPAGPPTDRATGRPVHPRSEAGARGVSSAWWLLPILFGTIGGIVAWALVHRRDPPMAWKMLLTGIGLSLVVLLVFVGTSSW
jgi:hypothetical protein